MGRAPPASAAEQIGVLAGLLRELRVPATALSMLLAHADAVRADAERLGLIAIQDGPEVLVRHTADSLLFALARGPLATERWVDVGSGAGFPGIPLACCYPETSFTLVEPLRKRAGFLEVQAATLGLANVQVAATKATSLLPGFDVATARALAEPAIAMEALLRLVEPEGAAIVAVGAHVVPPHGAQEIRVDRPGVDSPGRMLMIEHRRGGA